jgi:hypothetical protein
MLASFALAGSALAQDVPPAATSGAGSGGLNNPGITGAVPDAPVPRLPNDRPDFTGVWSGGGPIGDIREGLMDGEELILLPEAQAMMDSRLSAEDPEANCLPTGVPRIAPYPWRIVQVPAYGEATHLYFLFEGNIHSFRQIFRRPHRLPHCHRLYNRGRCEQLGRLCPGSGSRCLARATTAGSGLDHRGATATHRTNRSRNQRR